jgi:hypothetical protein
MLAVYLYTEKVKIMDGAFFRFLSSKICKVYTFQFWIFIDVTAIQF